VVHNARYEGGVRLCRSRVHGCRQRDVAVAGGSSPTGMQRTAAGKLATYDRLLELEGRSSVSLQPYTQPYTSRLVVMWPVHRLHHQHTLSSAELRRGGPG
jgi:hypothetical protein